MSIQKAKKPQPARKAQTTGKRKQKPTNKGGGFNGNRVTKPRPHLVNEGDQIPSGTPMERIAASDRAKNIRQYNDALRPRRG